MFLTQDRDAASPETPAQNARLGGRKIQQLWSLIQSSSKATVADAASGPGESNRSFYSDEERKRRRLLSNRESAKRSRWRKKRHAENLAKQVSELKNEIFEIQNQTGLVLTRCQILRRENDWLRSDAITLSTRYSDLYQVLINTQYPFHQLSAYQN